MDLKRPLSLIAVLVSLSTFALARAADTTPPVFTSAPTVIANSNPAAPLTARVQVTTDEPTMVDVWIKEETRSWRTTPSTEFSMTHDLPLIGFRPDRKHRVNIVIRDAAGNRTIWPHGFVFQTPPLPANFPPLSVVTDEVHRMEPGVTLTSLRWSSPTDPGTGTYCVYLDNTGQVVWLYITPLALRDVIRMRNGHMLVNANNDLAQEIDLFGNTVTNWWAARLGTTGAPTGAVLVNCDSFHHEVHELPESEAADFIALSTELRTYPNYPSSEADPTMTQPSASIVGDVVVEFNRDGTIVRQCSMLDVVDPYRIGYGSLATVYNPLYGGIATYDWSHGNAASVDYNDDTWIVSLRSQDALLKIRRSDHSLVWIQGPHDNWRAPWSNYLLTPIGAGPFEWNYHEHGPHIDAQGNVTMFDNGNYRASPPVVPPPTSAWYSRAVRFHIDPIAMTTEQVWEYRGPPGFFDGQLGDAEPLPVTHNFLITEGTKNVPGMNKQFSRIFEVTAAQTQMVFQLIVNDPTLPAPNPFNWNCYRAERYSNVYAHL